MKPYERREANSWPYFKLATWDERRMTWRAGKATTPTREHAASLARSPGRYRIERFDDGGSSIEGPFDIK